MQFLQMEQMTFAELQTYTFFQLERLTAVYDRTQTDVDNKTLKGVFNSSDFNRIEQNIKTVCGYLNISFSEYVWTTGELPRVSDFQRWKNAMDSIKSAYDVFEAVPSRPFNTWQKWNQMEYFLYYTDYIKTLNDQAKSYCGEFYCGEYGLI